MWILSCQVTTSIKGTSPCHRRSRWFLLCPMSKSSRWTRNMTLWSSPAMAYGEFERLHSFKNRQKSLKTINLSSFKCWFYECVCRNVLSSQEVVDFISARIKPDKDGQVRPLTSIVEEVNSKQPHSLLQTKHSQCWSFIILISSSCWTTVWHPTHLETGQDVTTWLASSSRSGLTPLSQTTQRRGSTRKRQKGLKLRRMETTAKRRKANKGRAKLSQREHLVSRYRRYTRDTFCTKVQSLPH